MKLINTEHIYFLNLLSTKIFNTINDYKNVVITIIFVIVAYFTLFHQLGKATMYLWDESIYSLNAQEMVERGNIIEVYLNNQPDLFNSKPPFAIWCMALSIRMLGFNELAVRLPAALFAFFTGLLIMVFVCKETNNKWLGLAGALVLFSSTGYVGWHVARTADTDAIVAFWITLYSILGYQLIKNDYQKKSDIWWFFVALTFACLTKGIAGLLGTPAIFGWWLFRPNKQTLLKTPAFYYGILLFIFIVGGYYVLRSYYTDGYAQAVLKNELGGRMNWQHELNAERTSFDFYINEIVDKHEFFIWIYWFLLAVGYGIYKLFKAPVTGFYFLGCWMVMLGLLSASATKFEWYDAPLFPLMAIIVVLAVGELIQIVEAKIKWLLIFSFITCAILLIGRITEQNIKEQGEGNLKRFMQLVRIEKGINEKITFINKEARFNLFFYMKKDELEGYSNAQSLVHEQMEVNTLVAIVNEKDNQELAKMYNLQLIAECGECKLFKVLEGRKIR